MSIQKLLDRNISTEMFLLKLSKQYTDSVPVKVICIQDFELDSTTSEEKSNGVGLALVKFILSASGAKINIHYHFPSASLPN